MAIGFWTVLFLGAALAHEPVRSSIKPIFVSLSHPKIAVPLVLVTAYVVALTWVLFALNVWDWTLLKDTILWFVLVGATGFFRSIADDGKPLWEVMVADQVRIIVVVEFIIAFYTFPLLIELVLIPLLVLIAMMSALAEGKPKYAAVSKFLAYVQGLIGLTVLAFVVAKAIGDYSALGSLHTARRVALPALYSLALVPTGFLLRLYAGYDALFTRLEMGSAKDNRLKRYARFCLVRHLGLSPQRVRAFQREKGLDVMRVQSRADVEALLRGGS